jgi:quercetin 2,3-dioxygenase
MRKVVAQYRAGYTDYEGLATYRAMPTRNLPIEALDPFIFLNHHGPQVYLPNNSGLPFGPHPHKGFETVTFILEGDIMHADSTGFKSTIVAGGVQWMTAGRGIVHSETSSETFRERGGPIHILQLWVNLPSKLKNTSPNYIGLQKEEVPVLSFDEGKVNIHLVSGSFNGEKAPVQSLSDVHLSWMHFKEGGLHEIEVNPERTVLFYVINGKLNVNGAEAEEHDVLEFAANDSDITIKALQESIVLFGHAAPTKEPIVAHGPFVMNTQEEIRQAFLEYQRGEFGKIEAL